MSKKIILIVLLITYTFSYSQDKFKRLNHSVFVDLTSNSSVLYTYYNPDKIQETSLKERGAVELIYNFDYTFIKKMSIGATIGYTHFTSPKFSSIKAGVGMKYYYIKDKMYFFTLQYGYHIPFNRDHFSEGHQIKIGQYFDITNIFKNKRLLLGIFYNYDYFYLDGAKPLLQVNNKPSSLKYNSYGLSLGLKF